VELKTPLPILIYINHRLELVDAELTLDTIYVSRLIFSLDGS
jgi:hypothetical protein